MSLAANSYEVPLVGFSWDSNTPLNKDGWETAKRIAENNGPKLAQFILEFKSKCKDTDIRPVSHSLGGSVVDCFDFFIFFMFLPGDNHCGYIGFRGLPPFESTLRDDGSIDVVVQDWLSD